MNKPTLVGYIKEKQSSEPSQAETIGQSGPFVTISRQFGCSGYELADLLAGKLNQSAGSQLWKVYHKDILAKLASQSGVPLYTIERARTERVGFLQEILHNIRLNSIPDTFEVRSQIAVIVRDICLKGYAIVVGQGGAAATADLENGLSVRVEAPLEWRIPRVCRRENIDKDQAIARIEEVERARAYLRQTYVQASQMHAAFNLTFDNSVFTPEQLAGQILLAMSYRGMAEGKNIACHLF